MEVLVAVIAFAGALLAVIATGALISRLRSEPKGWLIAWSITTASLSVSLGVIAIGYLTGFGAGTFRVYQLTGSMLAPLWLAVGAIQLLARKGAARFASWLLGIALTVIATVILAVDPVLQDKDFAKVLPLGSHHWDLPSKYLLLVVHVIAAIVLLAGLLLAVVRWRGGDDYDADNMHALLVLGPTGLALVGAVSFAVPGMFTALLLFVTAAAVWYVMLRPLAPYEDDDEEEAADDDWENRLPTLRPPEYQPRDVQVAGRRMSQEAPGGRALAEEPPRRSGLGDLVAEYRAGDRDVDYAARMGQQPPPGDDRFGGPATGMFMAGEYGMPSPDQPFGGDLGGRGGAPGGQSPVTGQFGMPSPDQPFGGDLGGRGGAPGGQSPVTGQFGMPSGGPATGEYDIPAHEFGRHGASGPGRQSGPGTGEFGRPTGPATGEFGRPGSLQPMPADQAFGGAPSPGMDQGRGGFHGYDQAFGAAPASGARYPDSPGGPGGAGDLPGGSGRPSPSIFGMLTVFTLLDGTGERFDRLAEETVEAVRRSEPDTLIYACHSVKSAPLQRIVYEIYRDEVAYSDHQRRPHTERFVTERQPMVLATNVIELTMNAAKVMPLPTAFRP
ncbi:putative quinol monooxygenase [Streptosporangium amethystogenes]|uniref:putative quinol monooxygenase n=1 Tax=Streptosporangium amethystogenes TaxID=2002 RepID=UPI00379C7460